MAEKKSSEFDPDEFQMTIGDHLEELRRRLLLGLAGLIPAVIICLFFGKNILAYLCRPLVGALSKEGITPMLQTGETTDVFMLYIKLSMITAAAIAGPWLIYQIWQFISTGLYPTERKYVTKYIPLSIALLFAGMAFVFFVVLPWSLQFFISFSISLPAPSTPPQRGVATSQPTFIQASHGDPKNLVDFQDWFDLDAGKLKFYFDHKVRVIQFGPDQLIDTKFAISDYLDLVLQLLLTFGLAFQLPLVVMALARLGIVDIPMLRSFRRYVYFGLVVLAAALSPGDVVTATVALLIPLVLLYEFGIVLAKMGTKPAETEKSA